MSMNKTTFVSPDFTPQGTLYIVSANKEQNHSLEFEHFRKMLGDAFALQGYTIVNSMKKAKQIAIVSYGMDNGHTKTVSTPIYGYDDFNRYSILIPGYPMPNYAIVGMNTVEYEEYTHVLAIEIVEASTIKSKHIKQLYSAKVVTKNSCPMITPVFNDLVAGFFTQFPGSNAQAMQFKVQSNMRCSQYQ